MMRVTVLGLALALLTQGASAYTQEDVQRNAAAFDAYVTCVGKVVLEHIYDPLGVHKSSYPHSTAEQRQKLGMLTAFAYCPVRGDQALHDMVSDFNRRLSKSQ